MDQAPIQPSETAQPTPSPTAKPKIWPLITITLGVALLVTVSGIGGYFLFQDLNPVSEITNNSNNTEKVLANLSNATLNTNAANLNTNSKPIQPLVPRTDGVNWVAPEKISSLNIFDTTQGYSREQDAEYYKVGEFLEGKYAGYEFVLVSSYPEGPSFYPDHYRFARNKENLIFLQNHSDELYERDGLVRSKFTIDDSTAMSSLTFPEILNGPKSRQVLELDPYVNELFDAAKLKIVFIDENVGQVYTTAAIPETASDLFERQGFYVQAPDGTVKVYKLKIDIMEEDQIPLVTWNDGTKNTTTYKTTDLSGCGSTNYAFVVSPDQVDRAADLLVAGTTSKGDPIYELKDRNHTLLKNYYENDYQVYTGEKVPYDEFVNNHPLFFWVDSFDRLIQFQSNTFIPQVECRKPVIYLYPEKTNTVSVQVKPKGGLSYSEPLYHNGWNVKAEPNGKLTELDSGKTYPYLFWEGSGAIYEQPKKGFVTRRDQVHAFLKKKLVLLGLNQIEIKDFLEFWEPRMQSAPYYFVTFLGNREMNQLAPLTIEPKPDTILRVLMDFTPLQQPINVQEYQIKTPKRNGFTVVEWGGVLR